MRRSSSADKMRRLRGDRPQCSYTIDTPSWDDEKSRFRAFRNNYCVGNRNVTIALVGFVGAILAIVGAFAYVHGAGRAAYEPPVNDDEAPTAAAEIPALVAVARETTGRRPSRSTPHLAAAPLLVTKTPSPPRRHPGARAERRSPRRTPRKQHPGRRTAPATRHPRRRQRVTTTRAGRARRITVPEQEEVVTALSGPLQKRKQQQPQQTRSQTTPRIAGDEDDMEQEDRVAASTPLPKHLVPRHYSVLLHPHNDGSRFVFTGVVKITAKCVESTRQVVLHAAGIQVNNAKVSFNVVAANRSAVHDIQVRRVEINNSTQQVTLELASFLHAQVVYNISISYVGRVGSWPKGLYKVSYKHKNGSEGWMALTRMKPMYARRVFPCFDEPSFRATFDVEILRRKDFSSIASMPIFKIEMSANHNDYVNDVFVRTPPIPTYLLGFAVTDFKNIGTGIAKVWYEPSSHTRAEFALQTANTCLELYEKYFRTRYPLPKLDIIITPAGAEPCESEGIVFLPSSYLTRYNLSLDARKQAESIVYRHVLKQWIGGLVSFHTWRELWLDAALEAYILYALARMQNTKSAEDDDRFEIKMQQMLSLEASQDIPALSRDYFLLGTNASLAVRKGELLLHMFDSAVGSNGIRNALQELMVKWKHQTITEQNLWEELYNVNNESFPSAHVAHAWTHSTGFPLLTISRVYGQRVAVARQERYGQNASKTVWSIPVTYTDGTKMDFDNTGNIFWLTTKEAKLPSAPKDDDWLIANLRGCGYYRVNYDPRNWNLITMELNTYHTNIDVINRARIIDDVFELADLGIVPYGTALHASEYLRREKETLPWTTVLKRWEYLEAMLGTGVVLEKWKLFIIRILIHHIHSFKWSYTQEDDDKRQLRIIHYRWACRYRYGPCLIEARHAFDSYKSPQTTSKPILLEHQFTVFCTVIEDGDEVEWTVLRTRLEQVSDGVERRNIILALGCTRDRNRLHRYFEEFSAPSMRMVPILFTEAAKRGNFWRLRTTEYILANWEELKTT
ncbi:aminopeptidase N-like isoform X2 [Dermacentor variabilis]